MTGRRTRIAAALATAALAVVTVAAPHADAAHTRWQGAKDAVRYDVTNLEGMPVCQPTYSVLPCVFAVGDTADPVTLVMSASAHVFDLDGRNYLA